jgi:WD40 repeat protein
MGRATLALWLVVAGVAQAAGPPPLRLDRHGDPLPRGAKARLGTTRFRLQLEDGTPFLFSPDGKVLVLRKWDGGVAFCDARTGKELRRLVAGPRKGCRLGGISPDGRLLATAHADGGIRLWDMRTAKCVRRLPGSLYQGLVLAHNVLQVHGHVEYVLDDLAASTELAFVSGKPGLLASFGADRTLRLWDTRTGKEKRHQRLTGGAQWAAFSSDGRTLLLWNPERTSRKTKSPRAGRVVWLWEVLGGKKRRVVLPSEAEAPFCASPDARFLAVGVHEGEGKESRADVLLLDTRSGKVVRRLRGGAGERIHPLAFSADGKHLAASLASSTLVWKVPTGRRVSRVGSCDEISGPMGHGAFTPDGKALVFLDWSILHLWDVKTGKKRPERAAHASPIASLAFAREGKILFSGTMSGTRVWESATGRQVRVLRDRDGGLAGAMLLVSADGRTVVSAGLTRNGVAVSDGSTCRVRRRYSVFSGGATPPPKVALSSDGRILASKHIIRDRFFRSGIDLLDPLTGRFRLMIDANFDWAGLSFCPEGKILASAIARHDKKQCEVRLWDVGTGRLVQRLRIGFRPKEELPDWDDGASGFPPVFSPDGRMVAVPDWDLIHVWERATGGYAGGFSIPRWRDVRAISFIPDGRFLGLVVPSQEEEGANVPVQVWDFHRNRLLTPSRVAARGCAALSPDGKTLATATPDCNVLLWRVPAPSAPRRMRLELQRLWDDLAGTDVARAFRAVAALSASPRQALPLLKKRLRRASDAALRSHLALLDSDDFDEREAASAALADALKRHGSDAESLLRRTLARRPGPEVRRRLRHLLRRGGKAPGSLTPEQHRAVRAVQVLEQIGNAEARRLLRELARGAPPARLTVEAKDSLRRLAAR